jgi:hypothetical protein
MFREMRRKRQKLSKEKCIDILNRMTSGVLALYGDEGYPYAVPISYVYHEGRLFFHSAVSGHKIDAISRSDKASFCVISQDEVRPSEFTTYFQSVIAFGKIHIVEDDEVRYQSMQWLMDKYSPEENECNRSKEMAKSFHHLFVIVLDIEHLTGKESIEMVNL